jgi:NAD(P)-dependent dehydrogenase (short-subunit alcohol dehydrogenase family)
MESISLKKTAIVTGVASGMGMYIAKQLAGKGYRVFGADLHDVSIADINCKICDVSDEEQVVNYIEDIKKEERKIDCLINVAGILCFKERNKIENLCSEEWRKVMDVNLDSVFYMTKYTIPLLKRSSHPSIVNFSSDQVYKIKNKSAPYAVSKAAIEMLTKISAKELLEDNIRANSVALASVETNFIRRIALDDEKYRQMISSADRNMPYGIIKVEDVWNIVNYLISEKCKMTGQNILIDSGTLLQ